MMKTKESLKTVALSVSMIFIVFITCFFLVLINLQKRNSEQLYNDYLDCKILLRSSEKEVEAYKDTLSLVRDLSK
jgi:hypothetical protein